MNWYIAQNYIAVVEKIAIIDCGTNTFHLMIVSIENGTANILTKEKLPVKIGEDGINQRIIQPAAIERAIKTITYFNEVIKNHSVNNIYGFATSAFRNAANGGELRDLIDQKTNIKINIISGDREAELIFKGVSSAIDIGFEPALVMDIGGGSVEFIIGSSNKVYWKQSFEIGAQRLLDLFHNADPMDPKELSQLNDYLRNNLMALFEALDKWSPSTLVGASGTFDTLSDIYCYKKGTKKAESEAEIPLTLEAFYEIHRELIQKNRSERLQMPGMIEMRVDMIVVASALIHYILSRHQFDYLRVSTYALKEGVLAEVLKNEI